MIYLFVAFAVYLARGKLKSLAQGGASAFLWLPGDTKDEE